MREELSMLANQIRAHLYALEDERLAAVELGLRADGAYMADLNEEIAACRRAYVGASVAEIAVLNGGLFGRHQG